MKRKTWLEFENSGLLWFINTILHVFGWSIVLSFDKDNNLKDAYPARVKYRGFDEHDNAQGYTRLTKYMVENSDELLDDCTGDKSNGD